jgi:ADP-heptose:LPS heptosyltransferase
MKDRDKLHRSGSAGNSVFAPGLLRRLPRPPEQVAILCASRLGDYLCATPAFRAFKTALPGARFTLIGLSFVRELVERSRHLDAFEAFPGFPGMAEQFFDAREAARFFQRMQRREFDLAIQLHGSGLYSNVAALMLGARNTAGFVRTRHQAGRLDAALPWPLRLHAARRSLALALFLGAPDTGAGVELELLPSDRAAADRLLHGCKARLIGIHAGSRDPEKKWPAQRFAEAGSRLLDRFGGSVAVLGGPDEQEPGERIACSIGPGARNLAGKATIPEMAAVIARLSVLVTTDSAPAHMAYALGVPSVTLFGITDPAEWGPPSRTCHKMLRSADRRLASLSVGDVVRAAEDVAGGPCA